MSSFEHQPGIPHSSDAPSNWAADTDPVAPAQLQREEQMSTAESGDFNLGQAPAPVPAAEPQLAPLTLSPAAPVEPLAQPAPPVAPVAAAPPPMPVSDMRDVPLGTLIFGVGLLT